MRKHRQLACAATLVAALAIAAPAAAAPQVDTSALRNAVTYDGIHEHLAALQALAVPYEWRRAHAGDRHRRALELGRVRRRAAARPPDIDVDAAAVRGGHLRRGVRRRSRATASPTRATTARPASGTPPTSPATATRRRRRSRSTSRQPTDQASASDSGCEAADFGPEVAGKVVLLQRGTCDFGLKAELAGEAGAIGAVIFNEGTIGAGRPQRRADPDAGRLHRHHPGRRHRLRHGPRAGATSPGAGRRDRAVNVHGFVQQDVPTANVIAETPGGRADRTVVVGGHLDSVFEGPGINDDGSGVGTMLETAEAMADAASPRATRCGSSSSAARSRACSARSTTSRSWRRRQIQDISVMLDFDMLASRQLRAASSTTATATSTASPARTARAWSSRCSRTSGTARAWRYQTIPFDGRSDYDAFTTAGIPAGGIFAGAEELKTAEQVALYGGTLGEARSTRATTSSATR